MTDSAIALSKKYGAPLSDLLMHVADLLERFRNRALMDTCQRVGGDPTRKLSGNDRLIGASRLMIETGMSPAFISIGSAGALYRYLNESGREQSAENAAAALREIAGDAVSDELFAAIMDMYAQFLAGESPAAMRRAAQNLKAKNLGNIV